MKKIKKDIAIVYLLIVCVPVGLVYWGVDRWVKAQRPVPKSSATWAFGMVSLTFGANSIDIQPIDTLHSELSYDMLKGGCEVSNKGNSFGFWDYCVLVLLFIGLITFGTIFAKITTTWILFIWNNTNI